MKHLLHLFLCAFLLSFAIEGYCQPSSTEINQLNTEIGEYEEKIQDLERQVSRNIASGNTSANAQLRQEIESYEEMIMANVERINYLRNPKPQPKPKPQPPAVTSTPSSTATNKNEKIVMDLQEEIRQAGEIIEDLEKENLSLRKQQQKLLQGQGGTAEVERLEKKIEQLEKKEDALKAQLRAAQKNNGSGSRIGQLSMGTYHFLRQTRRTALTNLLLSYTYNFQQQIEIQAGDQIIDGMDSIGTFTENRLLPLSGHRFSAGWEFLFNRKLIGVSFGLLGDGAYYEDRNNRAYYAGGKLQMEISLLPLRLGILGSSHLGYTWGQFQGVQASMNNGQQINQVDFSSLYWGYDAKVRFYLSRFVAFTGSLGMDYVLSKDFKQASYRSEQYRFGVGLDILLPLTSRSKRVIYY